MRYQELIYIQNNNNAVRNKDITNVSMSSDICVFNAPSFIMSGASKIDCTGTTGTSYVITTATTIPISFNFTGNTNTFTAATPTFKYEVYKYNNSSNIFSLPPVYQSNTFNYSSFSGTNVLTDSVSVNNLNLDGEYLIKGYFNFDICTTFLNKLGKTIDTLSYRSGKQYGLYDNELDYYFIAIKSADKPIFVVNGSNTQPANQLFQQVILPTEGQTVLTIANQYSGFFVLTLNGLVLAPNYDYTYSANVVTLNSPAVSGDIITVVYTSTGGNNLVGDNIYVNSNIVSGITDAQSTNNPYFNTTTNKFEIYTSILPVANGSILVMINGITLANGIDYYQSSSNPKRIILEGNLLIGDMITIVYFPTTSVVNGLNINTPTVSWTINNPPQLINGTFSLEISTANTFSTLYSTHSQDYIVGKTVYYDTFTVSGTVGTTLYYRVKNQKNYQTICGNIVNSTTYSDTIPVIIQTNSINTY